MILTSALYAYSTVYSNRGCLTPMGVAGEQVGGGGKGEGRPITSAIFGLRNSGLLRISTDSTHYNGFHKLSEAGCANGMDVGVSNRMAVFNF